MRKGWDKASLDIRRVRREIVGGSYFTNAALQDHSGCVWQDRHTPPSPLMNQPCTNVKLPLSKLAAIETVADITGCLRSGYRLTFQNFKMFPSFTEEEKVSSFPDWGCILGGDERMWFIMSRGQRGVIVGVITGQPAYHRVYCSASLMEVSSQQQTQTRRHARALQGRKQEAEFGPSVCRLEAHLPLSGSYRAEGDQMRAEQSGVRFITTPIKCLVLSTISYASQLT